MPKTKPGRAAVGQPAVPYAQLHGLTEESGNEALNFTCEMVSIGTTDANREIGCGELPANNHWRTRNIGS